MPVSTFRHIVSWKYKNNVDASTKAKILDELKSLPFKVKGIVSFTMNHDYGERRKEGKQMKSSSKVYDFALVVDFVSQAAYEEYKIHPAHTQIVQDLIKPNISSRVAVQHFINDQVISGKINHQCRFRVILMWKYKKQISNIEKTKEAIHKDLIELSRNSKGSANGGPSVLYSCVNHDVNNIDGNYDIAAVYDFDSQTNSSAFLDQYNTFFEESMQPFISDTVEVHFVISNPYIETLRILSSPLEQDALRNYKYSGSDLSLTYKYVLSPWAQFCVDKFIPLWMAPNLITFLGLLCPAISLGLFYIYTDGLDQPAPSWVYLLNSLALFAYQTLDNMDGKQARKTGSSSALGMLFDHGCDAINSGIGAINFISIIGASLKDPWVLLMCLATPMVPFYIATWEEYYVNALVLPIFNGPSEGVLIGCGIGIVSAIFGPDIWWTEIYGIKPAVPSFCFSMMLVVLTVLMQISNVLLKCVKEGKSVTKPLLNLFPFIVLCILASDIILNASFLVEKAPRLLILVISSSFVEMVCALMLTHMSKVEFNPLNRIPLLLPLMLLAYFIRHTEKFGFNETIMMNTLYAIALFMTTYTFLYLVCIVVSLCKILDIYCFRIKQKSA